MNTITMPGFTADQSVYKPQRSYRLSERSIGRTASQSGLVQPMQHATPLSGGDVSSTCFGCFPNPSSQTGCSQVCLSFFPFGISLRNCSGCQGNICGGIAGIPCPGPNQYCDFGTGKCNVADAQGTCKTRPQNCFMVVDPVCGCDGNTYTNSCYAAQAGVSIDYKGKCGGIHVLGQT